MDDPQTVNAVNLPLQNALNFRRDPASPTSIRARRRRQLRRHRRDHRPRGQPQLRRRRQPVRRQGRLANWWTPQDLAHFKQAGEALAAQYDAYRPFPDLAINGHQVLSENIADLAGLAAAYDAYHLSLNGRPANDRDFFVAFAQSWRDKSREEAIRVQVATDGHSPDAYRAATVRNLDPWYAAFGVTPAQKMYLPPDRRVRVW